MTVLYLLAGLLLGSAFLWPGLCWLAVPAIAITAFALARRENRVWRPIGGLLLGSAVSGTMILFWVFATLHEMFGFSTATAALAVATAVVTLALLSQLPACLFLLCARRIPRLARIPVWLWFPLAWALGELLLPTSWGALLHSQWANGSVLRAVYQFGWYPPRSSCSWWDLQRSARPRQPGAGNRQRSPPRSSAASRFSRSSPAALGLSPA